MLIIKYCKREHNVALQPGRHLRLGSLSEYRKIDHEFIGDPNEASRGLAFAGSTASTRPTHEHFEALRQATGVQVSCGPGAFVDLGAPPGGGAPATMGSVYQAQNAFVFCCRLEKSTPTSPTIEVPELHAAYDSFYQIIDPMGFAEHVRQSIHANASNLYSPGVCRVEALCGAVEYRQDRSAAVPLGSGWKPAWATEVTKTLFVKDTKYQPQREYRFVFVGFDAHGRSVAPRHDHAFLPAPPRPIIG